MSYADPAPEAEAVPVDEKDDTVGEAVNPPLPDQGQSDGNDEEATDMFASHD